MADEKVTHANGYTTREYTVPYNEYVKQLKELKEGNRISFSDPNAQNGEQAEGAGQKFDRQAAETAEAASERTEEKQYSVRNTEKMGWNEQIDAYFGSGNKTLLSSDSICFKSVASLLNKILGDNKKAYMPVSVIRKAIREETEKSRSAHGLSENDVRNANWEGEFPALTIINRKRGNALIFPGTISNGKPIMIAVKFNGSVDFEEAYKIVSIHARKDIVSTIRNSGSDSEYLANENKLKELCRIVSIQSGGMTAELNKLAKIILQDEASLVNGKNHFNKQHSTRGNGYDGYSMSNNARDAYENGEMPISKWTKSAILDAIRKIDPEMAARCEKVSLTVLRDRLKRDAARDSSISLDNIDEAAEAEAVAHASEHFLGQQDFIANVCGEDMKTAGIIRNFLNKYVKEIKAALRQAAGKSTVSKPESRFLETQAAKFSELQQQWSDALRNAQNGEQTAAAEEMVKENAAASERTEYSTRQDERGRWYVQAEGDKVLTGRNSQQWAMQIHEYFRELLGKYGYLEITTDDGSVLTITGNRSGKAKTTEGELTNFSDYTDKTTGKFDYSNARVRATASLYIDEIVKISKGEDGSAVEDVGSEHGDLARNGFTYRTVFFRDVDGFRYRLTLSVPINESGRKTAYGLGNVKYRGKESVASNRGPSLSGAPLNATLSFDERIAQEQKEVNSKNQNSTREQSDEDYFNEQGAIEAERAKQKEIGDIIRDARLAGGAGHPRQRRERADARGADRPGFRLREDGGRRAAEGGPGKHLREGSGQNEANKKNAGEEHGENGGRQDGEVKGRERCE